MRLALALLLVVAAHRGAHADGLVPPELPRVLTAPTAWLPAQGELTGMVGFDPSAFARSQRHGDGGFVVGYGLGGIADVQLGTDTDVRGCMTCDEDDDARPAAIWLGRAAFRLGAPQDALFAGMPAVVLGVRTTFTTFNARAQARGFARPRVSDAYVVASRVLGPLRAHAGASLVAAGFEGGGEDLAPTLRPLAGLEWTPAQYPRTTLMGDVAYSVRFEPAAPRLEWIAGWGVRYQAFAASSIELAVRHRQDEGLRDATVIVRLNAVTR